MSMRFLWCRKCKYNMVNCRREGCDNCDLCGTSELNSYDSAAIAGARGEDRETFN
jgi:hypothetical protein